MDSSDSDFYVFWIKLKTKSHDGLEILPCTNTATKTSEIWHFIFAVFLR